MKIKIYDKGKQLLLEKGLHHFPAHPEAEPALRLAQVDRPGSLVELDARGVPVEALEGNILKDANMPCLFGRQMLKK